jgi:hypothetical protein
MKKETKTSESNVDPDFKMHENGVTYREVEIQGLDKPIKLFTSRKPNRLEGETKSEYKIRRKLIKAQERQKVVFWDSAIQGPYVKPKNEEE